MNIQQKRQIVKTHLRQLSYKDKRAVENASMQLLGQMNSMAPKIDSFVFNNASSQRLFKLDGTIPINFQGKQYNIPVCFWLPLEFPARPPLCYVTPTTGMSIKPRHRHVDAQGFIYHPYLHEWNRTSDLVNLVGLLCSTFGADPPVYSGAPAQYQGRPQPQPQQGFGYRPQQQPQQQPQRPQQPQQPQFGYGQQPQQPSNAYGRPPQPYGYGQQVQQPSQVQPPQQPTEPQSKPASRFGIFGFGSNNNAQAQNSTAELKSRVEGKVRKQLETIYAAENEEMDKYNTQSDRLEENKKHIAQMQSGLETELELLTQRKTDLIAKKLQFEEWLAENAGDDTIDVNETVCSTDTWSKQCIEACAEDAASADVLTELDRALEDERIRLDVYLREVQKVARAQFMSRALAQEILQKQRPHAQNNNNVQLNAQPYFANPNFAH